MEVILMNKNTKVLIAEYLEDLAGFSEIKEIINIDYAPLIIKNYKKNNDLNIILTEWFRGRGIPEGRDKLDILMHKLDISSPRILLNKAFGLSLSDQYWIKPFKSDIYYSDINFFENDFNDLEFTEATFSLNKSLSSKVTFKTPNNTTDGMLRKTWIINDNKRYLLKMGFKNNVIEPFNEVLASLICKRLFFSYVDYKIDIIKGNIVSKCECFINTNTEFVPAYQILKETNKENSYNTYIELLEQNGIKNAKEKIDNMFVLDYLMLNNDRHLNNFGIIRDVNTLKWIDVAPIFDTGNSLNIIDYSKDEMMVEGNGRFFYEVVSFEKIIKRIGDLKRLNTNSLEGIVEEFDNLLQKYKDLTKMSDRRINNLCTILNKQIISLDKIITNNK